MKASNHRQTGLTLAEVMIGVLLSMVLVLGAVQFARNIGKSSDTTTRASSLETKLSAFQSLMSTDLARAGSDPSRDALWVYRSKEGVCNKEYFYYGIVKDPTLADCSTKIGTIGIVSYQGIDVNRDRIFYPEEGLSFQNPTLRPPAPTDVTPAAPQPLPTNFYNDYIVYEFNRSEGRIYRKNLGSPDTTQGDFSEVVLNNVVSFSVVFEDGPRPEDDPSPAEGAYFSKVTVEVIIKADQPEQDYVNPNLAPGSSSGAYRTAKRSFTHHVLMNALSIY